MSARKTQPDEKLPRKEVQERFERAVDHMLSTPPKKHAPLGKKRRAKEKRT